MNLYNIDILGLSETNIPNKHSSYTCRSKSHTSYFHNSDSPLGSGVGIILSNNIAKYVRSTKSFKGRVIYVDLYMKGHTKLRIIQVYLYASLTHRSTETRALYKELETLVRNSTKDNFKLIFMGDFNLNYDKFHQLQHSAGQSRWQYSIMEFLQSQTMIDVIDATNDLSLNPLHTFTSVVNNASSRIDYIWVSHDIITEVISSHTFSMDFINTDHAIIRATFKMDQLFGRSSQASLKQHGMKRQIFLYDKMNRILWEDFANTLDDKVSSANLNVATR